MKTRQNYPIAQRKSVLSLSPKSVVSLLDIMRELSVDHVGLWMCFIERYEAESSKPRGAVLSRKRADYIREHFLRYLPLCNELGWAEAGDRLGNLTNLLGGYHVYGKKRKLPTAESVSTALLELRMAITNELESRKFVMIEASNGTYLQQDKLFGELVYNNFDSGRSDIKDAGNCLAAELNTAAVFHLMRALEFGLRALASHLKVKKFKKKPGGKPIPVDLGTWEEIIVALNEKLVKLRGITRSKKRESELEFYNELLNELRSVKDLMRNKVMHARVTYDFHQAKSAFDHVKAFMQRLATKVSETK